MKAFKEEEILSEEIISNEFERIRLFLNLPSIPLVFYHRSGFNSKTSKIYICNFKEFYNDRYLYSILKYKLNSDTSKILFVLAHELGHFYHYHFYGKHFNHFKNEYDKFQDTADFIFDNIEESQKAYRKLKLEKIADNIGFYVLKNLYCLDLKENKKESYAIS